MANIQNTERKQNNYGKDQRKGIKSVREWS